MSRIQKIHTNHSAGLRSDRVSKRIVPATIASASRFPFFDVTVRIGEDEQVVTRRGRWADEVEGSDIAEISLHVDVGQTDAGTFRAQALFEAEPRSVRGSFYIDLSHLADEKVYEFDVEIALRTPQIGGGSVVDVNGFSTARIFTDNEGGVLTVGLQGGVSLFFDEMRALTVFPTLRVGGSGSAEMATTQHRQRAFAKTEAPQRVSVRCNPRLTGGDRAVFEFRFDF